MYEGVGTEQIFSVAPSAVAYVMSRHDSTAPLPLAADRAFHVLYRLTVVVVCMSYVLN